MCVASVRNTNFLSCGSCETMSFLLLDTDRNKVGDTTQSDYIFSLKQTYLLAKQHTNCVICKYNLHHFELPKYRMATQEA